MAWFRSKLALSCAAVGIAVGILYGCSEDFRPESGGGIGSVTPPETCVDGMTRECHGLVGVTDGIKSCFVGVQTCSGQRWGACSAPRGQEVEITNGPTQFPNMSGGSTNGEQGNAGSLGTMNHRPALPDAGCGNPCDPACEGWYDCREVPEAGTACVPVTLIPSIDPADIAPFNGIPPGHVNKLVQDNDCWGNSYGHECGHWPHKPGNGQPTLPWSACQGDTYCKNKCCAKYDGGQADPAGSCVAPGPDLTIGVACKLGSNDYFPVCNRGSTTIAAGTAIYAWVGGPAGGLPQATAYDAGDINSQLTTPAPTLYGSGCPTMNGTCTLTLASALAPGQCQNMTCGNVNGTKYVYLNSKSPAGAAPTVAECDLNGSVLEPGAPVAPGCSNNWTAVGNSDPCVTLLAPKILTYQYHAECSPGSIPQWGRLAWNAVVPLTSNILFEVRTRDVSPDGGVGAWGPWVTAGDTPPDPAICPVGGPNPCPKQFGPALGLTASKYPDLELRITLDPTSPIPALGPILNSWSVSYSCVDYE